jgi:tetratricopeptide (TPR) repeat protein
MNPDQPTEYEQLTPEEAAQIDAVCDRFERAWKGARAGGPVPCLASFMGHGHGPARAVLLQELIALDRTCRDRYGLAARPAGPDELDTQAGATAAPATHRPGGGTDVPAGRPADWPSIPGLELVGALGSGGMGVVYKARQATLDRDVAVKFLRDAHLADPERHERFLQEARAVARLRHPHLVQVYEFGEVPAAGGAASQPYLVLEYVPGGSLAGLLRGSPQPPQEAARLIETLADAIHYAHQQGVVHRDLKPANVLLQGAEAQGEGQAEGARGPRRLSADLCAKVTDFGLAKLLAGSDLTHSGHVLGTPSYMAPEQAAGKSGPVTAAVDGYGLGAILYEVLTGRPPFAAATADATLIQVRQDEPVPPRRLQPTVPRDLETICLKCLRKEPGRRYATAQDLADDLRRFRAGEPIRARPVGAGERVVVWCRRKPGVAGLLAALVLVFLAGGAGVLWQWQRAAASAAEADRQAAAFKEERDVAERRLHLLRERVDGLTRRGRDLLGQPGQYAAGKALLDEALILYDKLLPEDPRDRRLRLETVGTYGQVGGICQELGQWDQALEAYGQAATMLSGMLEEEPANRRYLQLLANNRRYQGNVLRDVGRVEEARKAYDQAARIHGQLYREGPTDVGAAVDLANTLLNKSYVLSPWEQAEELEDICVRAVGLDRAALEARPGEPWIQQELAMCLEGQVAFLLAAGRHAQALPGARELVAIRQQLFDSGQRKGVDDQRYLARSYANLGRVLAEAGAAREAEQAYRKAVFLLGPFEKYSPSLPYHRAALADTLVSLADLLNDPGRRSEAEETLRRVIHHYETLKADFPKNSHFRRHLVRSYLKLVSLLWALGRQSEAAEPYRKALEVGPEGPDVNNERAWFLATSAESRLRDAALAVRLAQKAVAARPQSAGYRNTLGVAHYRNGDDRAAVAELEKAMSLRAGGNGFDWFFLAMAHWRLGDRDQARACCDRAVRWMDRHKPHDGELRRFRAEAEALLAEARTP